MYRKSPNQRRRKGQKSGGTVGSPVSNGSYMTKGQLMASRRWQLAKPESLLYQTIPSCNHLLTHCSLNDEGVTGHELVLVYDTWQVPQCKAQLVQSDAWRKAPDDAVIRVETGDGHFYYPTDIQRLCTKEGEFEVVFS